MSEGKHQYVVIQDWMLDIPELKGSKLIVFALIYGFSQDGESWFTGSASYIAKWCKCSKKQVYNILRDLVSDGLLERRNIANTNGVSLVDYRVPLNLPLGKKVPRGREKTSLGGREKTSPHNIEIDNLEDNKRKYIKEKRPQSREDVLNLFIEKGLSEQDAQEETDAFYDFYNANGWKTSHGPVQDWRACVGTFVRNFNNRNKNQATKYGNSSLSKENQSLAERMQDPHYFDHM